MSANIPRQPVIHGYNGPRIITPPWSCSSVINSSIGIGSSLLCSGVLFLSQTLRNFFPLIFFTGVNEFTGKDITHDWMEFNVQFQQGL